MSNQNGIKSDKTNADKAIERLEKMIDKTIITLDAYQGFVGSEYGDYDEDVNDLKNEFCAFREYWINYLKPSIKTEITKESLEKFGMELTNDPVVPMLKALGEGSAGFLNIGVSRYRNADEFTLSFSEGMFYLNITCIEDLEKLESMIQSYEPNF